MDRFPHYITIQSSYLKHLVQLFIDLVSEEMLVAECPGARRSCSLASCVSCMAMSRNSLSTLSASLADVSRKFIS